MTGGTLGLEWREADGCLYMTGPAEEVVSGEFSVTSSDGCFLATILGGGGGAAAGSVVGGGGGGNAATVTTTTTRLCSVAASGGAGTTAAAAAGSGGGGGGGGLLAVLPYTAPGWTHGVLSPPQHRATLAHLPTPLSKWHGLERLGGRHRALASAVATGDLEVVWCGSSDAKCSTGM